MLFVYSLFFILMSVATFQELDAASYKVNDKKLLFGAVQFPRTLPEVPELWVSYGGDKLPCETDNATKRVLFNLPTLNNCTTFYLLITEKIRPIDVEDNTVGAFALSSPDASYQLYKLEQLEGVHEEEERNHDDKSDKKVKKPAWRIVKMDLGKKKVIPDYCIIVRYNPDLIEKIDESFANFELPKIVIKSSIINLGIDKIQEDSVKLLLSSLDLNTVHASVKQEVKKQDKTRVTLMS